MARLPDAAVCDTHALIHFGFKPRRLGALAKTFFDACDEGQAVMYVPTIVMVEMGLVWPFGSSASTMPLRHFFEGLFANPAYQPFNLSPEQVYMATEARPNDDPFDALICAAARRLEVPLLTNDGEIEDWGQVRTIW